MKLHELKSAPKARNHKAKTLGRGHGSGLGKTSGRGQKGQKARKSGRTRPGFEGGQTPLYRRLPKFGFDNGKFNPGYVAISVKKLAGLKETRLDREAFVRLGLIPGKCLLPVKIVAGGELKTKLAVSAQKFSAAAKKQIEAAGGTAAEVAIRDVRHALRAKAAE